VVGRRRPRRPARGSGERDVWPLGNRPPVALSAGWSFGAALAQADGVSGVQIKSAVRSAPGRSVCSACTPARTSSRRAAPKVRAEGKRAPCPSLAMSADSPVRGQSVCRTALSADRTFAGQGVKKRGEPSAPSPAQAAEIDKMRRKIGAREIHNWRRARARAPPTLSVSQSVLGRGRKAVSHPSGDARQGLIVG